MGTRLIYILVVKTICSNTTRLQHSCLILPPKGSFHSNQLYSLQFKIE